MITLFSDAEDLRTLCVIHWWREHLFQNSWFGEAYSGLLLHVDHILSLYNAGLNCIHKSWFPWWPFFFDRQTWFGVHVTYTTFSISPVWLNFILAWITELISQLRTQMLILRGTSQNVTDPPVPRMWIKMEREREKFVLWLVCERKCREIQTANKSASNQFNLFLSQSWERRMVIRLIGVSLMYAFLLYRSY